MQQKSFGFIIGLAVLLGAGLLSWWLLKTAPTQEAEDEPRSAKIAQTISISPQDHHIKVVAHGSVVPARQLDLRPQVSGRIISHHPQLVPGGRLKAGDEVFEIEDADYLVALSEAKSELAEAQAEEDLEQGRQAVAQREYEQLLKDLPQAAINKDLVLRKPFKARTQAALDRAQAAVDKANLNLERTHFNIPFNAIVIDEQVEIGKIVSENTSMATIVGSDAYWVQASVPLDQLKWITLPQPGKPGAKAVASLASASGDALQWQGKVVRLLGSLEASGRTARILVEVPNPLDTHPEQPLLLGSYLKVEIDAGLLKNSLMIPRSALREGNRIWLVGEDKKLIVREVDILWVKENSVFIKNLLKPGEHVIVSDLRAPVPGMELAPELMHAKPDTTKK